MVSYGVITLPVGQATSLIILVALNHIATLACTFPICYPLYYVFFYQFLSAYYIKVGTRIAV